MGTRVTIGGYEFPAASVSLSETSTPISAGDTSGGVGEISVTFPRPDPDLLPDHPLNVFGPGWLKKKTISVSSTRLGSVSGVLSGGQFSFDGQMVSASGPTRLRSLLVFNLQARPFSGFLRDAFLYYFSLAGVTSGVTVAPSIANKIVTIPGWKGELWTNLKNLLVAQDCDLSLLDDEIVIQPIRQREVVPGFSLSRSNEVEDSSLAQSVEVYWYDTEYITNGLVYPVGGWTPETEVLTVNAGETAEYTLELSSSLTSIQAPSIQTFVSSTYSSSSVYTVVADDGLPVPTALWADNGGRVTVTLNPDTSSLSVSIRGAVNIPVVGGAYSKSFSLALASDDSGSRYSTLRIVGTGVRYQRNLLTVKTGVSASETSTEVGETIDNLFLNKLGDAYRAAKRAVKRHSGKVLSLSGSVLAIKHLGFGSLESIQSYNAVNVGLDTILGAPSYDDAVTYYTSTQSWATYDEVEDGVGASMYTEYSDQTFGNVQGSRVWDSLTRRWYRIREASISEGSISFSGAEGDLSHGDVATVFAGATPTYGDVLSVRTAKGMTYYDDFMAGAYVG